MEEKYDGDRVALQVLGDGTMRAYGRRGRLRLPHLFRQSFDWHGLSVTLDGELLSDRYVVFDLLDVRADSLRMLTLAARKNLLAKVPVLPSAFEIAPFAATVQEKVDLLKSSIESDKEGVVMKDVTSLYKVGRNGTWQKFKFHKTLEAVVVELGGNNKPESARLALIRFDNSRMDIGGVKIPMIHQVGQHIQVGDVVEIRYLYVSSDLKLYQPVFLRRRLDKVAADCRPDQIVDIVTGLPSQRTTQ